MSSNGHGEPESLADLKEAALLCRDLKHAWEHAGAYVVRRWRGQPREVSRVLYCPRCTTERHDYYHLPSWVKERASYRYPEGYQLAAGGGHVRGEDVRAEVFSRVLTIAEGDGDG